MLTIHYSQVCDVCGKAVDDKTYRMNMARPGSQMPIPSYPLVVNDMQVCIECLGVAMDPLRFKLGMKK